MWVDLEGIPLQCRSFETFENICSPFGNVSKSYPKNPISHGELPVIRVLCSECELTKMPHIVPLTVGGRFTD